MKIPQRFLPDFLRSDKKAVKSFTAQIDTLKRENEKLKTKAPKKIRGQLTERRKYIATMQQDELKFAVELAKDPIRPRREMLYSMYDEVWDNDGHTIGESRKAILKVIGSPFGVFNEGSDELDELATKLLQKKWFEDYRKYFQQAPFFGHSLVQFVEWVKSKEKGLDFEVKKVELIPREHVRPEQGYIVMDVSDETGIPFREERFKKALMLMEMGEERFLGLLRLATKEFIWKNYSRSDWSRHSEKFGMPFLQIKTDTTNETELRKIENMAANFGNNMYYIGDTEDEIDIKEATFKDSYQIYKELAMFCNSEVSKAISGGTGTSDEKSFVGSAKVHEDILNEFVEANKRAETYHINEELFPFLIENGYPFEGKVFRYLDYQSSSDEETPEAEDENQANPKDKKKGTGGNPAKKSQRNTSGRALFT